MKAEMIREKIKSLFGKKGFGFVAMGLLAWIVLLMLPKTEPESGVVAVNDTLTSAEYCALLEQKATNLICELPEVDSCAVFVTLERGYRYVYATDQHVREESASKETEKTIVLADNGKGEEPILIEETMPKVYGVAVVCKGASYETQYRIIELMCAIFDIASNRISVQT